MPVDLDGSMDAAAAAIDLIPVDEISKGGGSEPLRSPDGRFQKLDKTEDAPKPEAAPADDAKTKEAAKPEAEAEAEGDDEDYIELPPEAEGKEPTRYKLSEVLASHREVQTLKTENAKLKEQGPAPEVWDQQIIETLQTRQKYMAQIEQWARLNQPQPPDLSLVDETNPNWNPQQYFAQVKQFEALKKAHADAKTQHDALAEQQRSEQEAIERVKVTREAAKLEKIWPELKEKSVSEKVRTDLKTHYGLDEATIDSVTDSRFFALAKDALAHRQQQAVAQTAAKIVSAKPKLIPGKARPSSTNGKATSYANSMGKLQTSHSIDDATTAIAALLQ